MGLPGHRRTSSHKRRRAAHFAMKPISLGKCPKCQEPKLPHRVCGNCGTYAGRQVIKLKSPLAKKGAATETTKAEAKAKKAEAKATKAEAKAKKAVKPTKEKKVS